MRRPSSAHVLSTFPLPPTSHYFLLSCSRTSLLFFFILSPPEGGRSRVFEPALPRAWPSALATWFFDLNPLRSICEIEPIGEQYLNRLGERLRSETNASNNGQPTSPLECSRAKFFCHSISHCSISSTI